MTCSFRKRRLRSHYPETPSMIEHSCQGCFPVRHISVSPTRPHHNLSLLPRERLYDSIGGVFWHIAFRSVVLALHFLPPHRHKSDSILYTIQHPTRPHHRISIRKHIRHGVRLNKTMRIFNSLSFLPDDLLFLTAASSRAHIDLSAWLIRSGWCLSFRLYHVFPRAARSARRERFLFFFSFFFWAIGLGRGRPSKLWESVPKSIKQRRPMFKSNKGLIGSFEISGGVYERHISHRVPGWQGREYPSLG